MRKTVIAFGLALLISPPAFADTTPSTPATTITPTPTTAPVTPVEEPDPQPPIDPDGPRIKFCSLAHLPTGGGNFALPMTVALAAITISLRRRRA